MSKAVFTMETPKNCYECPFSCEWFGDPAYEACCELYGNLLAEEEALITEEYYDYESKEKPDWCPLKPLPEKKEYINSVSNIEATKNIAAAGWNACLDEITGGNSDD